MDKKDRIVFMGDSITDCNRNYQALPAGWSSWGEGYVNLINAYTTALFPEKELMIVNQGVSGDTIVDLINRWEKDCLSFQPNWVTVMIGINDIWRQFDGRFMQTALIDEQIFEKTYRELIEKTKEHVKGMILLSPFMVEGNKKDPMREKVDNYREITQRLAEEYQLLYGDCQKPIDEFLTCQSSYVLSSDRVHPSLAGHLLLAKVWLESIKLEK